jgi:hypothetical protein
LEISPRCDDRDLDILGSWRLTSHASWALYLPSRPLLQQFTTILPNLQSVYQQDYIPF